MHKAETICKWLFWATAAAAIVYGAAGTVSILTSPMTGFPWWAAWAYAALYFAAPLLAGGIAWALLHRANHKHSDIPEGK